MQTFQGLPISGGIATGSVLCIKKRHAVPLRYECEDTAVEIARFFRARDSAQTQYRLLADDLEKKDKESAMIFRGFFWMLSDDRFDKSVISHIREGKRSAEAAVIETQRQFLSVYDDADESIRLSRSADLREIVSRLLAFLSEADSLPASKHPYILVSEDLMPSDLLMANTKKLLGIVTSRGSAYSHIAVLSRMLEIPAVIGIDPGDYADGQLAVLDGYEGQLFLDPTDECIRLHQEIKEQKEEERRSLSIYIEKKAVLPDGRSIPVYANISSLADLSSALKNGAEGIGLFRSEFLYLGRQTLPDEETQFSIYKDALTSSSDKEVTVRTMDLGGDKIIPTFPRLQGNTSSPSIRGIRFALMHRDVFRIQLRALLRASAFGKLSILYPMISSLKELSETKKLVREVADELKKEGVSLGNYSEGIMIETPSAVELSDLLAKECDFFSIGTNDLIQYTFAIDRSDPLLTPFLDTHYEAIFRQIDRTVQNAHSAGIPVRICGEMAGDLSFTKRLLSLELDAFSVAPVDILPLRQAILSDQS